MMYILLGILFIIVAYTYAIKFLDLNTFYFKTNPDIGNVMYTLNKYTGADIIYDFAAKKGYIGKKNKKKELDREFVILNNDYESTIEYDTDDMDTIV